MRSGSMWAVRAWDLHPERLRELEDPDDGNEEEEEEEEIAK